MKPLDRPDSIHLAAAKGWCELDAFEDADAELDKITPLLRAHPSVLEVRWQIYSNLEKWEGALDIANAIVALEPDRASGWIYRGSSLAQLKRPQEAYEALTGAAAKFPSDEIIAYDLACVCCLLGRVEEARQWLSKSIDLRGDEIKLKALDDPDLAPLFRPTGET